MSLDHSIIFTRIQKVNQYINENLNDVLNQQFVEMIDNSTNTDPIKNLENQHSNSSKNQKENQTSKTSKKIIFSLEHKDKFSLNLRSIDYKSIPSSNDKDDKAVQTILFNTCTNKNDENRDESGLQPKYNDNFTKLLDPQYANRPPRSFEWILKASRSIFDEKSVSDTTEKNIINMPTFVLQWSTRQYGLNYLSYQCSWDLINSARAHQNKSNEIEMFNMDDNNHLFILASILCKVSEYRRYFSYEKEQEKDKATTLSVLNEITYPLFKILVKHFPQLSEFEKQLDDIREVLEKEVNEEPH